MLIGYGRLTVCLRALYSHLLDAGMPVPLCSGSGPCVASPQGLITQSSAPSNCYLVSKLLYVSSRLIYCFLLGFLGFFWVVYSMMSHEIGGGEVRLSGHISS